MKARFISRLTDESGFAFILAILSLLVMMILGVSFVSRAVNGLAIAERDRSRVVATSLAESGVDLAVVKLYENYDNIIATLESAGTYQQTYTADTGRVSYQVWPNYQGITNTALIESVGVTTRNARAKVRVIARYLPDISGVFKGAVFSNNPLTLNGAGAIYPDPGSNEGGDIYARGNIIFNGTSFDMNQYGNIYTTGTTNWVPDDVPATNVHENIAPIPMPVIDMDWYRQNADVIYNSNQNFGGDINLQGIVFVDGNVNISGTYEGSALIVATGRIRVTGNVTASNPTEDTLVLMSPRSITIAGGATVEGLIYAHNVDASIQANGNVTIKGAIVADVVTTSGSITVTYNNVWKNLPIPGSGKKQWAQVSWQQLY